MTLVTLLASSPPRAAWFGVWFVFYLTPLIPCVVILAESWFLHTAPWWALGLAISAPQYGTYVAQYCLSGNALSAADLFWVVLEIGTGPVVAVIVGRASHQFLVQHRFTSRLCVECGYPLRGLFVRRCPECGALAGDEYVW